MNQCLRYSAESRRLAANLQAECQFLSVDFVYRRSVAIPKQWAASGTAEISMARSMTVAEHKFQA